MPDRLRPNPGPQEELHPKASTCLFGRGCAGLKRSLQYLSGRAVNSLVWRVMGVVFTLLLLFGSSIQFWFFPASADPVFDALYIVGFAFFWVDILFNVYTDPEYFVWDLCRNQQGTNQNLNHNSRGWGSFRCGSYNFWCDFVSSGGFLYDVSFINQSEFAMAVIPIALDSMGVPVRATLSLWCWILN
jgi:hypothetical protein